jgi:hypothetical protein
MRIEIDHFSLSRGMCKQSPVNTSKTILVYRGACANNPQLILAILFRTFVSNFFVSVKSFVSSCHVRLVPHNLHVAVMVPHNLDNA